ncbi:MAG: hypothetical protein HKO90_09105, partial [Flavobacteriaceae bacterium]|nr:hypothetical protein [Flavobacteriaceae bacterium]
MIKNYALTLLISLFALFYGHSQLSAGDIAIVQYNADGTDDFSFVALVEISPGQVIFFTDNEENTLTGGEGTIEWTAPAGGLSCGDIITITTAPSATAGTVSENNDLNFNADGDSVLAYTGSAASPTFIAALSNDGGAWGGAGDGNLPPGLTNGTSAIAISPEVDNCAYNATLTNDTQNNLLGAINNNGNWTLTSNTVNQSYAGGTMTVTDCAPPSPAIIVSPAVLTGLDYTGPGPSAEQTYTLSGTNLTPASGNIAVTAPANFEVSLTSGGGFAGAINVSYSGSTLANTTIYVRLAAGLGAATYGPSNISNTGGGASTENVSVEGTVSISGASDILAAGGESASISSLENVTPLNTTADGVEVWQFQVRDGGGAPDGDALATILTDLTITQGIGNQVTTWTDAIQHAALFDGAAKVADGAISATQIDFNGMNVSVNDDTNKTLSLRISLICPLGPDAFDGEDFTFRITNANTTFSPTGSAKAAFSQQNSTNDQNIIEVTSTELRFTTQPVTTGVNTVMSAVVVSATDSCGNIDVDFTGDIGLTSSGTMLGDPITVTAVNGSAVFVGLNGIE